MDWPRQIIQSGFKSLARKHHPDHSLDDGQAMKDLTAARDRLLKVADGPEPKPPEPVVQLRLSSAALLTLVAGGAVKIQPSDSHQITPSTVIEVTLAVDRPQGMTMPEAMFRESLRSTLDAVLFKLRR